MSQLKYKLYATLLDAFQQYLDSEKLWNQFYGFSDDPKISLDEYEEKSFKELIDKINRVPFDSEAADKGTAFNEVVDCIIENRKSDKMEISVQDSNIHVLYKERHFDFPILLCKEFAGYFNGALTQQNVEAKLPTIYGDVLLYGYIDELMPLSVHDIKTTGQYSAFKFRDHFQHLVYPYCLIQNGNDIRIFEYNVTDFKNTYTESYTFVPERDIPILTNHVERLIEFLEQNRDLITDRKVFNNG